MNGGYCPNNGQAEGILEYDYTMGYGPETTWIKSTGHCTAANKNKYCRMVFKVKNYNQYAWEDNPDGTSYDDPSNSIGQSGLVVHLFRGTQHVADYRPPPTFTAIEWPVFTIDLSNKDVHEGEVSLDDPLAAFVGPAHTSADAKEMFSNYATAKYEFISSDGPIADQVWLHLQEGGDTDGYFTLGLDSYGFNCLEAKHGEDGEPVLESALCASTGSTNFNSQLFQLLNLGSSKPAMNIQIMSVSLRKCRWDNCVRLLCV
jgi:hypothetical protein